MQGGSLFAKHSSIMQQLTIQFEGYADEQRTLNVSDTKDRVGKVLAEIKAKVSEIMPQVKMAACATLSVLGSFGLMFFAALIQG